MASIERQINLPINNFIALMSRARILVEERQINMLIYTLLLHESPLVQSCLPYKGR